MARRIDKNAQPRHPEPERARSCRSDRHDRTFLLPVLGQRDPVSIRGSRERKLAAIAELQRGRASRRQLLAAGITSSMIKTMLGNGRLLRRYPGVYAVGHAAPVEFARETEVLLACPDGALLSHVSAGALWGIVPHPGRYAAVDITIAGTQTP